MPHQHAILGTLALVISLFISPNAISATFTVDSFVDGADAVPGDGSCNSVVGGLCTLRAAIQETNALASDDIIVLETGIYTLTIRGTKEDAAATGDLDITGGGNLIIQGAGILQSVVDAGHPSGNRFGLNDRVFHIHASAGSVTFNKFTAKNAWLTGENGGGIYNAGPNTRLNEVTVSDNNARALLDQNGEKEPDTNLLRSYYGLGGGIFNDANASLLLDRSQVIFNAAQNSNFYDIATQTFSGGGGIRNLGYLEIRNQSRIESNTAQQGGGISNTGSAKIADSIIMFNAANKNFGLGGGISNQGGVLTIRRSYISQNICFSCDGGGIASHPGASGAIVTIIESAIDNNKAQLAIGGGVSNFSYMYIGHSSVSWNGVDGLGGGISNSGNGELILENTTIIGNTSNALGAYGAGIHTSSGMTLNHVTLTANQVRTGATPTLEQNLAQELFINTRNLTGVDGNGNIPIGPVIIKNSIIGDEAYRRKLFLDTGQIGEAQAAQNNYCGGGYSENDGIGGSIISEGDNIFTNEYLALIKSEGYNISNGSTCALTAGGDQTNTAPDLLDAGAYGGAILPPGPFLANPISRPPTSTSAALDVIPADECTLAFDQRMFGRSAGNACDVGAAERGDLVTPYVDLDLSVTPYPGLLIASGQSVFYEVVIKNLGSHASNNLGGSALTADFSLNGMTLIESSFIAPEGVGQVSCAKRASIAQRQILDCSFDSPLMPGAELFIYLTLATSTSASKHTVTAQVTDSALPDPFDYNNQVTLNHQISANIQLRPIPDSPTAAIPMAISGGGSSNGGGGTMSFYEILILLMFTAIFTFYRVNTRIKRPIKFGVSSALLFYLGTSHAVVPTVTGIIPNTGSATSATIITISGTGFDQNVKIGLLNDPNVSSVVTRVEPNNAFYVEKKNNLLYLSRSVPSGYPSINVYDVSNPSSPILQLNRFLLPARGAGGGPAPIPTIEGLIARQDNSLFISVNIRAATSALPHASLLAYDFTTPSTPVLQRTFSVISDTNGKQTGFGGIDELEGNLVYQAAGNSVRIVDMSITTGANIVGSLLFSGASTNTPRTDLVTIPTTTGPRKFFLVAGIEAIVNIAGTPTEGELIIFEVTDPTNPVAVYAVNGPPRQNFFNDRIVDVAAKLLISGSVTKLYAIVASKNGFQVEGAGLHVYDVGPDTGFTNINPVGNYHGLGNFDEVYIEGDVLTALDINLDNAPEGYRYYDFDISDPTTPKLTGGPYMVVQGSSSYPWNSRINDGYIYASGGIIYQRNLPINITNVTATTITATIPAGYIPQTYDLVVSNSAGETEEVIFLDAFTVP